MEKRLEDKLRKDFQKFIDNGVWQGEDEYTKNFGVGNVADWWIKRIKTVIKNARSKSTRL